MGCQAVNIWACKYSLSECISPPTAARGLISKNSTHIKNIVHLPSGQRCAVEVGYGGDNPTSPLLLDGTGQAIPNLGRQEIRLIHDNIPKQRLIKDPKMWIYQYRNGPEDDWHSAYSFAELEWFQEDVDVLNLFAHGYTQRRTVLVVRFLREGEDVQFSSNSRLPLKNDIRIVKKVMLVDNVVKVNLGGRKSVMHSFDSGDGRLQALAYYFGIFLTDEEAQSIRGWHKELG
ncbi:uncharacterized protein BDV17DRAFT_214569 [Aspergillus undulatus]|uniref:uncharacterized protein n=1 Tax=Aspergillus undulatus TaxID=1810928 RepID=UPI003CCCE3D6